MSDLYEKCPDCAGSLVGCKKCGGASFVPTGYTRAHLDGMRRQLGRLLGVAAPGKAPPDRPTYQDLLMLLACEAGENSLNIWAELGAVLPHPHAVCGLNLGEVKALRQNALERAIGYFRHGLAEAWCSRCLGRHPPTTPCRPPEKGTAA